MKINKSNPLHWLYLALQFFNTMVAVAWRPFKQRLRRKNNPKIVMLYGHKLSGNLLALYRYMQQHTQKEFRPIYLSLDPAYHRELKKSGEDSYSAISLRAISLLSSADAMITDHGLHAMTPLLYFSNLPFFDVWHGIPFKGFDADDFRTQHRYEETWVASPLLQRLYIEKFGFPAEKVVVTGYARTDALVAPSESPDEIRRRFNLQHAAGKRIVLFAPTWKQDDEERSLFPFGIEPDRFLKDVSAICQRHGAVLVVRAHINSLLKADARSALVNLASFDRFPDTEGLLQITDILVCDWSSIAFDFLILDRPAIFLDMPAPFGKRFSLGPEYRYGKLVASHETLLKALSEMLLSDTRVVQQQAAARHRIRKEVYGEYANGQSARRCVERLCHHQFKAESSQ